MSSYIFFWLLLKKQPFLLQMKPSHIMTVRYPLFIHLAVLAKCAISINQEEVHTQADKIQFKMKLGQDSRLYHFSLLQVDSVLSPLI